MSIKHSTNDPREMYPKPPFPRQQQKFPGFEKDMQPAPDYGADSYEGLDRLKDKVAVITGGDSGIGRAVAVAYAREGADVVISYYNEEDDAAVTKQTVEAAGRRCIAIAGDIQQELHCQEIIQATINEFGKIDVLINNAAYQMTYQSIEEITQADLEQTFQTNIYAMYYLCKAAYPYFQPGGSVINTASIQAYKPSESLLAYAPTKAAIVDFTKAFAKQAMQQKGVRVNAVAPGPVWTPLIPYSMPEGHVEQFGQDTTLGRTAQPVELAPVYVFLASDDASYVNGQIYGVTGGLGFP